MVEPSKLTFGEWLDYWVQNRIKPNRRLRTFESYESIIRRHLKPDLGFVRLQELSFTHLEAYYLKKAKSLSQTTLEHHHAVISGSLKWAQRKQLITQNVATLVDNRPSAPEGNQEAKRQCWTAEEAQRFLKAAKVVGPQSAAFYALALDTGARKGELCGLRWENVDLRTGKVSIVEQLVKPGRKPVFGSPKRGRARTIQVSSETCRLFKEAASESG